MDLRPEVTTRVDGSGCVAKLLRERAKFTGLQLCQKSRKEERCTRVFGRDQLRCLQKNSTPSLQPRGENSSQRSVSPLSVRSGGQPNKQPHLKKPASLGNQVLLPPPPV